MSDMQEVVDMVGGSGDEVIDGIIVGIIWSFTARPPLMKSFYQLKWYLLGQLFKKRAQNMYKQAIAE